MIMRRILLPILAILLCIPVMAEDIEIKPEQLPEKSQQIIAKAFPDAKIKKANIEKRASLMQYEVKISGGVKLQFSKDGTFTECDCTDSYVPEILIPQKIRTVIDREFPGRKVKRIEHDSKIYELTLDNGDELSFNRSYKLIDIDSFLDRK